MFNSNYNGGFNVHFEWTHEYNQFGYVMKAEYFLKFIKEHFGKLTDDMNFDDLVLLYECENDVIKEETRNNFKNEFNKQMFLKFRINK